MSIEVSIILIMIFIIVYVAILKIFSVLFQMTGISKEKSKFQAISLFTAVGYTTRESEIIASDRTRRKIATMCMITGNVFSVIIVSLIVNFIGNFSITTDRRVLIIIGIAFAVFLTIIVIFQIPFIQRKMSRLIEKAAKRTLYRDKAENVITLLDNYGDSAIVEIYINRLPECLDGKSIFQSGLKNDHDINILMLKRKGHVIRIVRDTMIQKHDEIVVFGSYSEIKDVFTHLSKEEKTAQGGNIIELIDNYNTEAMMTVHVAVLPERIAGKTLEECQLKSLYGINVLMVKRGEAIIDVGRDTEIAVGDEVILFGPYNNIHYLFANKAVVAEDTAKEGDE